MPQEPRRANAKLSQPKKRLSKLTLFNAIRPKEKDEIKKLNIHFDKRGLRLREKYKCLWASQIHIFKSFLKSKYKYLVIFEDDAEVDLNFEKLLFENFIKNKKFKEYKGCRLGPFALGNLYKKECVKKILRLVDEFGICRNLDHFVSNIKGAADQRVLPKVFEHMPISKHIVRSASDSQGKKLHAKPIQKEYYT